MSNFDENVVNKIKQLEHDIERLKVGEKDSTVYLAATAQAADSHTVDGLHAATSGADAHVLATDASGNATISASATVANNFGVGTVTPAARLHLVTPYAKTDTTSRAMAEFGSNDASNPFQFTIEILGAAAIANRAIYFGTRDKGLADGGNFVFQKYAGSVGIGMLPSVQFELSGAVGQKASGTTWSNPSDKRLKKNIKPFTDGLNVITKIKPVTYELNGLANTPKGLKGISVIAQEIKDVAPYTVDTYKAKLRPNDKEDTELYRFEASALIFALINAVKELSAKVEELEKKIT